MLIQHISSDATDGPVCYHCNRELEPQYDYSCLSCGRASCDYCSEACQADDCDDITCYRCVERHIATHPLVAR